MGFLNIIDSVIEYFPADCLDHCYFNYQMQFIIENIFLEL